MHLRASAVMTGFTCVIPSHVGYFWEWTEGSWWIRYEPVKGIYSPPSLHPLIQSVQIDVPMEFKSQIGRMIGKDGLHFKTITEKSGAVYIFYLKDKMKIEIWGEEASIHRAIRETQRHFEYLRHHRPKTFSAIVRMDKR